SRSTAPEPRSARRTARCRCRCRSYLDLDHLEIDDVLVVALDPLVELLDGSRRLLPGLELLDVEVVIEHCREVTRRQPSQQNEALPAPSSAYSRIRCRRRMFSYCSLANSRSSRMISAFNRSISRPSRWLLSFHAANKRSCSLATIVIASGKPRSPSARRHRH